jgi:hypothetical protein
MLCGRDELAVSLSEVWTNISSVTWPRRSVERQVRSRNIQLPSVMTATGETETFFLLQWGYGLEAPMDLLAMRRAASWTAQLLFLAG